MLKKEYIKLWKKRNRGKYLKYQREWAMKWRRKHPNEQKLLSKRHIENTKIKYGIVGYKKIQALRMKLWRENNQEKVKARKDVFKAIRNKTLKPQPCFCSIKKTEAHHLDYSKPMDVIWLCVKHHRQLHRKEL